ncbi:MAG: type IX secretion system membrane protein PorP/SprF [Bacteroidia bacterium]|nr:type IX secretion system membrane protein PorP/SprF [Bacteroidia bacterium]NNC84562.1 type IX secretion system membrane protein PorP/SprF [Bacteroidia bacterium]NNM16625.1 type IX secretion system membrane protein PorP/SprF [Bacteroidia bacterium]
MKKIYTYSLIVVSILFLGTNDSVAQQNNMSSQYMFSHLTINPAYAAAKPFVSASFMFRKQWTGFDGAPVTETASVQGLLSNKKVGLGAVISNDKLGITNQTDFFGNYAYLLPTGKGNLSLGLRGGFSLYSSNLSDLIYWDTNDPVYELNTATDFLPNAGFGAFYFQEKFYAGFSVPYLLNYDPNKSISVKGDQLHRLIRHYYVSGGYVIDVNPEVKVKPNLLVKYVEAAPVQFDMNVNVLLSDIIWIGASYRSGDAILGLVEYKLTDKFRIGYSYDATLTDIRNFSSGSHEIMIGLDFGRDVLKIADPRYF